MNRVGSKPAQAIHSVFIADDDSDDIELFTGALHQIDPGIQVEHVRNGAELTSMLCNYLPDLLFLDLDMPVKNGLQCLQEIRKGQKTAKLPTVVFSSTTRPANIDTAYEMGAHLFFIKPSNYNELVNSIKAILNLDWQKPEKVKDLFRDDGQYSAFILNSESEGKTTG